MSHNMCHALVLIALGCRSPNDRLNPYQVHNDVHILPNHPIHLFLTGDPPDEQIGLILFLFFSSFGRRGEKY